MIKTIQATKLRNNLKDALSYVKETKKPLIITERGVPTSVLVDIDEYEDYLMMQNPKIVVGLKESTEQAKRGEVSSFEDVFADVL